MKSGVQFNYPYVGLVVSVRNGFEDLFINKTIKKSFEIEYHPGFQESETIDSFFNKFNLPFSEIPLLAPEFSNPLFLFLFCKAFQKRSGKKKPKAIYRGHEGATYIFEHFVKAVAGRIGKKFNLSNKGSKSEPIIWDPILKPMAERMVNNNCDKLSEFEVVDIIKKAYPNISSASFLKELESNILESQIMI